MPTLNLQVVAGSDDAKEADDGTVFSSTQPNLAIYGDSDASVRRNGGFRFSSVSIPVGAIINSASIQLFVYAVSVDDMNADIHANDVDDTNDFVAEADVTSRVKTTATVVWSENSLGLGFATSPEIKTVIQEIIDRGGWSDGNAIMILLFGKSGSFKGVNCRAYDGEPTEAAKLDIVYNSVGSPGRVASSRGVMRGVRKGVM